VTYAADTKVPVSQSRTEIERTLLRYGATAFAYGQDQHGATIAFEAFARRIQFHLPLPRRDDPAIALTPTSKQPRTKAQVDAALAQAERARWRALLLIIKAKLEAIEAGVVSPDDEFLAHTMLPQGGTVGDWARPHVAALYSGDASTLPALMPGERR
jgi:hypothetical protein